MLDLKQFYRSQLLDDVVPFWEQRCEDSIYGGFVTNLNRQGEVYDWNKACLWGSGRMIWCFSHLFCTVERRPRWLELAGSGVEFAKKHVFRADGRAYYSVSRDGRPLEAPSDVFTDLFHVQGFSEYARASGQAAPADEAWSMMKRLWDLMQQPGQAHQPLQAAAEPVRMFGHAVITLNVIDELRRISERPGMTEMVDECLRLILEVHRDKDRRICRELTTWDGQPAPGFWGRHVTPGHMIEAGIFVVHEAKYRGDRRLQDYGVELIRWGYACGWDSQYGGIFNDIDCDGHPVPGSWVCLAPCKLWWQHAEALYGLLLAWKLTGDSDLETAYWNVHDYTFSKLADPDGGEWFAILNRQGGMVSDAKGSCRKSLFHVGRNLLDAFLLLDDRPVWEAKGDQRRTG